MYQLIFLLLLLITSSPLYSRAYPDYKVEKYHARHSSELASTEDILASIEKANTVSTTDKPIFTASAQLGFLFQTGNTKSADIKAGLDFRYEKNLWRSLVIFDGLLKKTELTDDQGQTSFDTTDNKWSVVTQTNYIVDTKNKNYLYGNLFYEENRFSSFDSQASLSTGWGRRWYEDSKASLDADIGPGFKRDVTKPTQASDDAPFLSETKDSIILQAQALYIRRINEHIEFKQLFVAKHAIESGENSLYKAETSVTSKLIDSLQLKLSFVVDYNSKVEQDKANTDTQTAAVLVYSF